jgi:hypothetical protein
MAGITAAVAVAPTADAQASEGANPDLEDGKDSGKKHTDHRIDNQKTIVQLGVLAATYFEHSIACSLKGSLLGFEPQLLSYRLPV